MSDETARVGELLLPMKVQLYIGDKLITQTDVVAIWNKTFELIKDQHRLDAKTPSVVAAREAEDRELKRLAGR